MMMHRLYRNTSLLWRIAHANHFQVRGITFFFPLLGLFFSLSHFFCLFIKSTPAPRAIIFFSFCCCVHSHCLLCSGSVSVFNFVLVSNNRGLILIDWQKRRGKALESIRKFNLGGRCTGTQLNSHRSRIEVFFVVAERDTGSPAANFLRFGTRWLEVVYFACFLGFLMFVLCLCLLMHTNLSID